MSRRWPKLKCAEHSVLYSFLSARKQKNLSRYFCHRWFNSWKKMIVYGCCKLAGRVTTMGCLTPRHMKSSWTAASFMTDSPVYGESRLCSRQALEQFMALAAFHLTFVVLYCWKSLHSVKHIPFWKTENDFSHDPTYIISLD